MATPSTTSISNTALDLLGQQRINDFATDTEREAVLCRDAYEDSRDEVLRAHPWNAAQNRRILAENLLIFSEQFDDAAWTKTNASATANQINAPNGLLLADLLDDADGGNAGTVAQAITVPDDSGRYALSIYLKRGTAAITQITMAYSDGTPVSKDAVITWASIPTVTNADIEDIGNGWWRVKMFLANNGTGNETLTATIFPAGAPVAGTGTVYGWGAQLSATDGAIGYAETTTVASELAIPSHGYNWSHLLPADYIGLYDVNDGDLRYKVENGRILHQDKSIEIRYTFQLTDPLVMGPLLRKVISLKMAVRLCVPFNADDRRTERIEERYFRELAYARTMDAQEDGDDPEVEDDWLVARR